MSFRGYLLSMASATFVCWGAVALVVTSINPFETGAFGLALFYVSLFLAVVGTLALLGISLRARFFPSEPSFLRVFISFRQALWFGILVDGALFLAHQSLLTWWTLLLFIALLTVLESLFVSLLPRRSVS